MKVYVFGNQDLPRDNLALKAVKKLGSGPQGVEFVFVKPNEDLPFANAEQVVIMDVIHGIDEVTVIDEADLDKLVLSPRSSVHDYDLGFQLRYLKKLGKLEKVKIIGLPMHKKVDYKRIQSILRKLVAQDMQGS